MSVSHKDFKETTTRPFHIQTHVANEKYREGFDRIDWSKKHETTDKPPAAKGKG